MNDVEQRRVIGTDIPDWHNVYTQRALAPPSDWTVQDADPAKTPMAALPETETGEAPTCFLRMWLHVAILWS